MCMYSIHSSLFRDLCCRIYSPVHALEQIYLQVMIILTQLVLLQICSFL